MVLAQADFELYLTVREGVQGFSVPQPDPSQSRGQYVSTTPLQSGKLHGLFSRIKPPMSASGLVDYRAIALRNKSVTDPANVRVTLIDAMAGARYAFGFDPVGQRPYNSPIFQAQWIASPTHKPTNVTFTSGTGAPQLVTLPPNTVIVIWIQRTVLPKTPAVATDTAQIVVDA